MVRGLVSLAHRWFAGWTRELFAERLPPPVLFAPPGPKPYRPLRRVVLADEVSRVLFDDYAAHRRGPRGDEEIGWVLLGYREEEEVLVVATLPAGADREAGVAHVRFNSNAQAVGARYVRQTDRRLGMVGVVHTHPGSLRHPSDGDFQGDSLWVGQLRGGEGVFAIGTADGSGVAAGEHMQAAGELCFSWYALGTDDTHYRRLPVEIGTGPDLARPLHAIWETIEAHADALDALCRQLAKVSFDVATESAGPALVVTVPVAEPAARLGIRLQKELVRYTLAQEDGAPQPLDAPAGPVDRTVYHLLAELAQQPQRLRTRGLARAGR